MTIHLQQTESISSPLVPFCLKSVMMSKPTTLYSSEWHLKIAKSRLHSLLNRRHKKGVTQNWRNTNKNAPDTDTKIRYTVIITVTKDEGLIKKVVEKLTVTKTMVLGNLWVVLSRRIVNFWDLYTEWFALEKKIAKMYTWQRRWDYSCLQRISV